MIPRTREPPRTSMSKENSKHPYNCQIQERDISLSQRTFFFSDLHILFTFSFNACVANGGWVLKDLGTDPNNPNPGRWDTRISLPYPQPSHEPRPPPQTPNQAPVTLNSTFNGETIEEKPLPPQIGRGGRGKTRKHTNATTPNAEPSQSHEAMRRHTSNTQRTR